MKQRSKENRNRLLSKQEINEFKDWLRDQGYCTLASEAPPEIFRIINKEKFTVDCCFYGSAGSALISVSTPLGNELVAKFRKQRDEKKQA